MDTTWANAVNRFNDDVASAASRAESMGVTAKELAEELRRIASEYEAEA